MKKLYVKKKDGTEQLIATGNYEIREVEESPKYIVKVVYDSDYNRDENNYWNEKTKFYSNHRNYRFDGTVDDEIIENLRAGEVDGKKYFPVYCYDHSGISLYKERYTGCDAKWDSGMFGVAEVDNTDGDADQIFENFFEELRACMEGEVYGFQIRDEEGEIVDSCYGFYGEDVADSMFDYISEEFGISLEDVKTALDNAEY